MERRRFVAVHGGAHGAIALALAFSLLSAACTSTTSTRTSTTTPVRPRLSVEGAQAQFGTLGVAVVERMPPELSSDRPKTRGAAAKEGAVAGLVGPPVVLGALAGPYLLYGVFIGLAISPLSTPIGAIYGALAGKTPGDIEQALSTLEAATRKANVQRRLRDLVIARLGREHYSAVSVTNIGTASGDIDTVVEMGVSVVSLVSVDQGVNPKLTLMLPCDMRIHRRGVEGAEVRDVVSSGTGEGQTLLKWAADDGQAFKEGIAHELERLAGDVVSELFTWPWPTYELLPPTPQPPEGTSCPGNSVWNGYDCALPR